jgi:hypothetical protein
MSMCNLNWFHGLYKWFIPTVVPDRPAVNNLYRESVLKFQSNKCGEVVFPAPGDFIDA